MSVENMSKCIEKQRFQLGDTAYIIDQDYSFFESVVRRISLVKGKYEYESNDCDFSNKDIGNWVFESEMNREIYMETLII